MAMIGEMLSHVWCMPLKLILIIVPIEYCNDVVEASNARIREYCDMLIPCMHQTILLNLNMLCPQFALMIHVKYKLSPVSPI